MHEPRGLATQLGLDANQARTLQLTSSFAVTIYPGANGMCMAWPQADGMSSAFICGAIAGADDGSFWGEGRVVTGPGVTTNAVFGFVPDGNETVSVTGTDGTNQTVPVANNMFFANVGPSGGFKDLVDHNASGQAETFKGVPGS